MANRMEFFRQVSTQENAQVAVSCSDNLVDAESGDTIYSCLIQLTTHENGKIRCIYLSDRQVAALIGALADYMACPME